MLRAAFAALLFIPAVSSAPTYPDAEWGPDGPPLWQGTCFFSNWPTQACEHYA